MSGKYQVVLLKGSSDSRAQSFALRVGQEMAEAAERLDAKYSQKQQPQPARLPKTKEIDCVNLPENKVSAEANTAPLLKPKGETSFKPGPLTPQEIESLRQDKRQALEYLRKNPPK